MREAVYLFLGRTSAAGVSLVVGAGEKFALSGIFGVDALGIGTRFAAKVSGSVAFVLDDFVVSRNLLRGVSEPEIPASD